MSYLNVEKPLSDLLGSYYYQSYKKVSIIYPELKNDIHFLTIFQEYDKILSEFSDSLLNSEDTKKLYTEIFNINKIKFIFMVKKDWESLFREISFGNIISFQEKNIIILPWPGEKINSILLNFLESIKWDELSANENKIMVSVLGLESHRAYYTIPKAIAESKVKRRRIYSSIGLIPSLEFLFKLPDQIRRPFWIESFFSSAFLVTYKNSFNFNAFKIWISFNKLFYKYNKVTSKFFQKENVLSQTNKLKWINQIYLNALLINDIEQNSFFLQKGQPEKGKLFIKKILKDVSFDMKTRGNNNLSSVSFFEILKKSGYKSKLEF
jgi:hypothetical protein